MDLFCVFHDLLCEFEDSDLQNMTADQVIEAMVARFREQGIDAIPGQTFLHADGKWSFRDWRVSPAQRATETTRGGQKSDR